MICDLWFMFTKFPNLGNSYKLSADEYTEESFINTNNSWIFRYCETVSKRAYQD